MPSLPVLVALLISPILEPVVLDRDTVEARGDQDVRAGGVARRAVPADDREAVHGHVGRFDRQGAKLGRTGAEGDRRVDPARRRLERHRLRDVRALVVCARLDVNGVTRVRMVDLALDGGSDLPRLGAAVRTAAVGVAGQVVGRGIRTHHHGAVERVVIEPGAPVELRVNDRASSSGCTFGRP